VRLSFDPDVSTTSLDDGGIVLLSQRTGKMYRGNATAATFWSALEKHGGDVEKATLHAAACYGVGLSRVEDDFRTLVTALCDASLLRVER
jgi:hypothetical protein